VGTRVTRRIRITATRATFTGAPRSWTCAACGSAIAVSFAAAACHLGLSLAQVAFLAAQGVLHLVAPETGEARICASSIHTYARREPCAD